MWSRIMNKTLFIVRINEVVRDKLNALLCSPQFQSFSLQHFMLTNGRKGCWTDEHHASIFLNIATLQGQSNSVISREITFKNNQQKHKFTLILKIGLYLHMSILKYSLPFVKTWVFPSSLNFEFRTVISWQSLRSALLWSVKFWFLSFFKLFLHWECTHLVGISFVTFVNLWNSWFFWVLINIYRTVTFLVFRV